MRKFQPSNLENIQQLFTEKTGVALHISRKTTLIPAKRVLILATIVTTFLALTCFALAEELKDTDILANFFFRRQDATLSDGQNEYIESGTAVIGESVTQNGFTVTVRSAITDGTLAYLLLDITAPENMDIARLPLAVDAELSVPSPEDQNSPHISSISTSCIAIDDHDEQRNTAAMLLQYHIYPFLDSQFSLADGKARALRLNEIFYHETDYPYEKQLLAKGEWAFSITFTTINDRETELLTAPVYASCHQISGKKVEASIFSLRLKGLSATVYYTLPAAEVQEASDFGVLTFITTDGNRIFAYPQKAGQTVQVAGDYFVPGTDAHYCAYELSAPADAEQIAAVQLQDLTVEIRPQHNN